MITTTYGKLGDGMSLKNKLLIKPPFKCDRCLETTTPLDIGYACASCGLAYDGNGNVWFSTPTIDKIRTLIDNHKLEEVR